MSRKQPRWKRIDTISPVDKDKLQRITDRTPGMTMYGNRARTSVMLPLELAEIVSVKAKTQNKTVNEVMVEMLEAHLTIQKLANITIKEK